MLRKLYNKYGLMPFVLGGSVLIFLLLAISRIFLSAGAYSTLEDSLLLPLSINTLIQKPWTIITFSLATPSQLIWSLLFNGLAIYFLWNILTGFIGKVKVNRLFISGIIAIPLFTVLLCGIFSIHAPGEQLWGLNILLAILLTATITIAPQYPVQLFFMIRIPIFWLGIIILVLNIGTYGLVQQGTGLAMMLGAMYGFLYIRYLKGKVRLPTVNFKRKKQKTHLVAVSTVQESKESQLNRLLDKINEVGYEGLSKAEKAKLLELSVDT